MSQNRKHELADLTIKPLVSRFKLRRKISLIKNKQQNSYIFGAEH